MKKLYIVQKYIVASSIQECLKIERHTKPEECWLDEDWKKAHKPEMGKKKVGFISNNLNNSMAKSKPGAKKGGKKC